MPFPRLNLDVQLGISIMGRHAQICLLAEHDDWITHHAVYLLHIEVDRMCI